MTTVDGFFVLALLSLAVTILWWGAKTLPQEKWQVLAAVPGRKNEDGSWNGRNLTYYGLIVAGAYTLAVSLFLLLMSSTGMPLPVMVTTVGLVLVVCAPASRVVARLVEKKKHTFTVGGASFVGLMVAPWIFYAVGVGTGGAPAGEGSVLIFMAALAIAYAFGEGLGRMACVSFGCCYGKRVEDLPRRWRRIFGKFNFIFTGRTKKIAYAHGWEGQAVVPVQLITAVLYVSAGLTGTVFFLLGKAVPAFLVPLLVTQLWRVASEFLRADFRGEAGRLTAYQHMALATVPYALALVWWLNRAGASAFQPDILSGLKALWHPGVLLSLQLLGAVIFFQTGRSMVTGSRISIFIHRDRI